MERLTLLVFFVVYAGMILGGLPRLRLDRTGVALLGGIVLVVSRDLTIADAISMIDLPTIGLLFGLMIISAQLRLGGFYARVSETVTSLEVAPPILLAALIGTVALLSAIFSNDIVCLAVPGVVIQAARRRNLDPIPFLLATACAANAGSAATLIGNPQNMLIGEVLHLSFRGYAAAAAIPVLLSLVAVWAIVVLQTRGRWEHEAGALHVEPPAATLGDKDDKDDDATFHAWQVVKGLGVVALLVVLFLFTSIPRELLALAAAGVLLTSRSMHSRQVLGLVDWQLLLLFGGLFITNGALRQTAYPLRAVALLGGAGIDLAASTSLFWISALLSNIVSNVPAVMLLLPHASGRAAGASLALASTLAGNLTIVGSIANIIVIDLASRHGIAIDWKRHARIGVPVTLVTMAIAWLVAVV